MHLWFLSFVVQWNEMKHQMLISDLLSLSEYLSKAGIFSLISIKLACSSMSVKKVILYV